MQVMTASADKTAKIWSATTGALVYSLSGHLQAVSDVNWSPDGSRVATASNDGAAKIWFAGGGSDVHETHTLLAPAFSLSPNPTDNSLHLTFATESAVPSAVQICDLLGRTVATAEVPAGTKEWTMSVGNLPAGVYVVRWGGVVQKLVVR